MEAVLPFAVVARVAVAAVGAFVVETFAAEEVEEEIVLEQEQEQEQGQEQV